MGKELTKEDLAAIVSSSNAETQTRFRTEFGDAIAEFIDAIYQAYARFHEVESRVAKDDRSAWVQMFLFTAFNNLLTSLHLLISGFQAAAGNLMRHFGEAIAMALLCSHRGIDTFDRFSANPQQYSVHRSVDLLGRQRNLHLLNVIAEGWRDFREITAWFDQFSHSSALSLASLKLFNSPAGLTVGGEFDPAKIQFYRKEIQLRTSACRLLKGTIENAERHLMHSSRSREPKSTDG